MGDIKSAAYIISQSVCAMAEIEGMKVENYMRERRNESPAWDYNEFMAVINKYGLDHNSVIEYLKR